VGQAVQKSILLEVQQLSSRSKSLNWRSR
jgi:hypothetical protein